MLGASAWEERKFVCEKERECVCVEESWPRVLIAGTRRCKCDVSTERESHVYLFTFAKRPQLGIKPKSNINSLNPGGERMNERECVRVLVYGRNGDGDGA